MLREVTSAEITDWIAYETLTGPIGDERLDILLARMMAHQSNMARTHNSQRIWSTDDCMVKWRQPEPQSVEEMMEMARLMTMACGGTVH